MQLDKAINSFHLLGEDLRNLIAGKAYNQAEWEQVLQLAQQENPWFTQENIIHALKAIVSWLEKDALSQWLSAYPLLKTENITTKIVGVVMAGNIPLVGFHDFLCVLLSNNILHAKLSHSDSKLIPFLARRLINIEPAWKERILFVEKLSTSLSAVITTGNNNTARHFEYYFRNIPHIIRKNRNGIALLDGLETVDELHALGEDIFRYFGLGCRNVSKLYVPVNYDFSNFFQAIEPYKTVINHNKYHSNYVYNRTIYLMDGKKFTDNGFLAVINTPALSSPIAVLNFEEYESTEKPGEKLSDMRDQIQCIVASGRVINAVKHYIKEPIFVKAGNAQFPLLSDYPDGIDVMKFLLEQSTS